METALNGQLDISADDLQDKIAELLNEMGTRQDGDGDGYATTDELVQASGVSPNTVRKRLRALIRAGRLEKCQVWRVSILSDARYPTQGYRLKRESEQ